MKKTGLFLLCIVLSFSGKGFDSYLGWSAGLSFSFGNKINRLGLQLSGYYNYGFAQANAQFVYYHNFRSIATRNKGSELQAGLGLELGFGREDSVRNAFVGLGENNMQHIYSVGYSYMRYWDRLETSQAGGMFSVNIDDFRLLIENDLFGAGEGWRDHFRTGAFLIEYQYDLMRFSTAVVLWTGDYVGCKVVEDDTLYPCRFGYRLQEGSKFGNRSAGLFSFRAEYLLPFNQRPRIDVGVDSEKVRNLFQNRLIHDQPFFPRSWIRRTPPHIPMLQEDGSQFLFREGQKVRPASFYYNLGLNNMPFY
ncbi:MAG: polymorphic toxin type 23 domain-containing protein [Flavobacteriales bacterium]|jgi:hypothetical protein|nr:polymorphic toxin type 23 domain-containing protein [Flavobacteriales bacterium]